MLESSTKFNHVVLEAITIYTKKCIVNKLYACVALAYKLYG